MMWFNKLHIVSIFLLVGSFKIISSEEYEVYYIHPDTGLNISQLLDRHGYLFENHEVQTTDGYLLGLHRIPHGHQNAGEQNKPVVLMVHGMSSQSIDFVNNEDDNSLGLLLADKGYDVWLLNCRGNTYSRKHIEYDPDKDKRKFWDFSWHEMGIYDVPNTIDYILNVTNQERLFYIGHSQGTTAFYVMASMLPEYNAKIRLMTALGPAAFMSNNVDIKYRTLARHMNSLKVILNILDVHELFRHNDKILKIIESLCLEGMDTYDDCVEIYNILVGYSPIELNMTLLPVHLSNSPSGFSVKQLLHYGQSFMNGGYFRQFDYGRIRNMRKYGQAEPPDYNLTNIVAPVSLHYAKADQLCSYIDVEKLADILPNVSKRMVPEEYFSHLDFIWGNNAKSILYDVLMEEMEKY